MKKTLLISLLALLGMTQAVAQEYEYVPFVREGVKWVYSVFNSDTWNDLVPEIPIGMHYCTLEIKGERLINGKTYNVDVTSDSSKETGADGKDHPFSRYQFLTGQTKNWK